MFKTTTDTEQAISLIYNSTSKLRLKEIIAGTTGDWYNLSSESKIESLSFSKFWGSSQPKGFSKHLISYCACAKGQTLAKNISNVTKLTGQMNCLHINSNLRFVSNVFLHRKKLLRSGHNVVEGIFFIVAKNLRNQR